MNNNLRWLLAIAVSLFAMQGYAQHSDIAFTVEDNQLVIEAEHEHEEEEEEEEEEHVGPVLTTDGKWLYEASFLTTPIGFGTTANPGFAADSGTLDLGTVIGFGAVGNLQQWDGFSWTTASGPSISLEGTLNATATEIAGDGVTAGSTSLIGFETGDGGFHSHINFRLNPVDSSTPENNFGAYLIELILTGFDDSLNETYDASESFYIAFNFGLDEEDFEAGIDALAAPEVPVPGAAVLMFSALSALGLFGARKRQQH